MTETVTLTVRDHDVELCPACSQRLATAAAPHVEEMATEYSARMDARPPEVQVAYAHLDQLYDECDGDYAEIERVARVMLKAVRITAQAAGRMH